MAWMLISAFLIGWLAVGIHQQENRFRPNAETAWDECNAIEDKDSNEYWNCIRAYDIGTNSRKSRAWFVGVKVVAFWLLWTAAGFLMGVAVFAVAGKIEG